MSHECSKEKEIDEVRQAIFGNGKDGLLANVKEIRADLKCLLRFQTQTETKEELREKYAKDEGEMKKDFAEVLQKMKAEDKTHRRWMIGMFATMFIGVTGLIITVLIAIIRHTQL